MEYDLTLVALPGREVEMIDLQDFDENAPASDDRYVHLCTRASRACEALSVGGRKIVC